MFSKIRFPIFVIFFSLIIAEIRAEGSLAVSVVDRDGNSVKNISVFLTSSAPNGKPIFEQRKTDNQGKCSFAGLWEMQYGVRALDTTLGLITDSIIPGWGKNILISQGDNQCQLVISQGSIVKLRLGVGNENYLVSGIIFNKESKSKTIFWGSTVLYESSKNNPLNIIIDAFPYPIKYLKVEPKNEIILDTFVNLVTDNMIKGQLISHSGKPVSGVKYTLIPSNIPPMVINAAIANLLNEKYSITNHNGDFAITTPDSGTIRVIFRHPNFQDTIVVMNPKTKSSFQKIILQETKLFVSGFLKQYNSSMHCMVRISQIPVKNQMESIYRNSVWNTMNELKQDGSFRIAVPERASYDVCLICEGYNLLCKETLVNQTIEPFVLTKQGLIRGQVIREDNGKPVEKFFVSCGTQRKSVIDRNGNFKINSSISGVNRVCINADGFENICDTITCEGNDVALNSPIKLSNACNVKFTVRSRDSIIAHAMVVLKGPIDPNKESKTLRLLTDKKGNVQWTSIPKGIYNLEVMAKSFLNFSEQIEIKNNMNHDVIVKQGNIIDGKVQLKGKNLQNLVVFAIEEIEGPPTQKFKTVAEQVKNGKFEFTVEKGFFSVGLIYNGIRILDLKKGIAAGTSNVNFDLDLRALTIDCFYKNQQINNTINYSLIPFDAHDTRMFFEKFASPMRLFPGDTLFGAIGKQYKILVKIPGFKNKEQLITIPPGLSPLAIDLSFEKDTDVSESFQKGRITEGRVYEHSKLPVGKNWAIRVGKENLQSKTDENGKFEIKLSEHDNMKFRVLDPKGGLRFVGQLKPNTNNDIYLEKPGVLVVYVKNAQGNYMSIDGDLTLSTAPGFSVIAIKASKQYSVFPISIPSGSYFLRFNTSQFTITRPCTVKPGITDTIYVSIPQSTQNFTICAKLPKGYQGDVRCFLFDPGSRYDYVSNKEDGNRESNLRYFTFKNIRNGNYRMILKGGESTTPFYFEKNISINKMIRNIDFTIPMSGIDISATNDSLLQEAILSIWNATPDPSGTYGDYFPRVQTIVHPKQQIQIYLPQGEYYLFANSSKHYFGPFNFSIKSDTVVQSISMDFKVGSQISATKINGATLCLLDSLDRPILKKWITSLSTLDSMSIGSFPPGKYSLIAQDERNTSEIQKFLLQKDRPAVIKTPMNPASWIRVIGDVNRIRAVKAHNLKNHVIPSFVDFSIVNAGFDEPSKAFRFLNTMPAGKYVLWDSQENKALDTINADAGRVVDYYLK